MPILVLADIHSNLEALQAVAADAGRFGPFDAVWCLGDVVSYGPDPDACIDWLREREAVCVAGNHDLAVTGREPLDRFNPLAAVACRWTQRNLTAGARDWLVGLPASPVPVGDVTLVHGSLRDPVWEYALRADVAAASLLVAATPWVLVGHSHLPLAFERPGRGAGVVARAWPEGEPLGLRGDRMLLNPGSVGQPRDGDARAAYAVFDPEAGAITRHRVEYDLPATQAKMRAAGLPRPLADRLAVGR